MPRSRCGRGNLRTPARGHRSGTPPCGRREGCRPLVLEFGNRVRQSAHAARGRIGAVEQVHLVVTEGVQEGIDQARLADAAGTGDRDEARPALLAGSVEQVLEQAQLLVAPDERRLPLLQPGLGPAGPDRRGELARRAAHGGARGSGLLADLRGSDRDRRRGAADPARAAPGS